MASHRQPHSRELENAAGEGVVMAMRHHSHKGCSSFCSLGHEDALAFTSSFQASPPSYSCQLSGTDTQLCNSPG